MDKEKRTVKKKTIIAGVAALICIIIAVILLCRWLKKPVVGVEGCTMKYGENGYVTLYIDNSDKNYDAMDITLSYNKDDMEILSIDAGDITDMNGDNVNLACTTEAKANADGQLTVLYVDQTAGDRELNLKGKKVDVVYFAVRPLKPDRNISICIENVHLVEADGVEYSIDRIRTRNGSVKVE